jgi:hypothetical protein
MNTNDVKVKMISEILLCCYVQSGIDAASENIHTQCRTVNQPIWSFTDDHMLQFKLLDKPPIVQNVPAYQGKKHQKIKYGEQ